MSYIFYDASAFDQDLGWCVDDGVVLVTEYCDGCSAFDGTQCVSTSCGVKQVAGGCAPTPAPTTPAPTTPAPTPAPTTPAPTTPAPTPAPTPAALGSDGAATRSAALAALVLVLVLVLALAE
jgi:hypothetical protein